MFYQLAAAAVLVAHLTFVAFAAAGGALTLRWPAVAWLHLPALAWAVWVELSGAICPLTPLELRLRQLAGLQHYRESFIEHYASALLYPLELSRVTQVTLGLLLLAFNLLVYLIACRRLTKKVSGTFFA